MKTIFASNPQRICDNPSSPFAYFGWPSVTRLPDGTLAMVASGFRLKHVCPFGKGIICYSKDEGRHWTRPTVLLDTSLDDRDCGIAVFADGRVILTSFNNTLEFQKSVNERERNAHPDEEAAHELIDAYIKASAQMNREEADVGSMYLLSEDGGYTFGEVRRAPITSPHGPFPALNGELLYIGRRFSANNTFDDGAQPYIECWRLNAEDEFEFVSTIPNVSDKYGVLLSCEPHAIQLPSGKIVVHIRVQRGGERPYFTVYQSESLDGGKSFSPPIRLLSEKGGSPAHLMLHSSGVLISTYGYRESPYGIRVMFSKDEGVTWDTDYVLSADGESGDLGYPATVELNDGSLLTVYYQKIGRESVILQRTWRVPDSI